MESPRRLRALLNPPNLVSVSRLLLVPVILWALYARGRSVAVVLFVVAMVTDWLDGFLARRLDMESALGRVLDPLADKAVIDAVAVALALRGEMPVWAAVMLVVRDLAIVGGALAMARGRGPLPASNTIGKIAFTLIGFMVLAHLVDWQSAEPAALWVGTGAAIASVVSYARSGIALARRHGG